MHFRVRLDSSPRGSSCAVGHPQSVCCHCLLPPHQRAYWPSSPSKAISASAAGPPASEPGAGRSTWSWFVSSTSSRVSDVVACWFRELLGFLEWCFLTAAHTASAAAATFPVTKRA